MQQRQFAPEDLDLEQQQLTEEVKSLRSNIARLQIDKRQIGTSQDELNQMVDQVKKWPESKDFLLIRDRAQIETDRVRAGLAQANYMANIEYLGRLQRSDELRLVTLEHSKKPVAVKSMVGGNVTECIGTGTLDTPLRMTVN